MHDLKVFNHNFQLKNFKDALLKIDGPTVSCKAYALEIFVEYIFNFQKSIYKTLSYVKVSILVPNREFILTQISQDLSLELTEKT